MTVAIKKARKPKTTPQERFLLRYRDDPVLFFQEVLDVKPEFVWPKMAELATAIVDFQKVSVPAGHSVSKTYTLARLVLWFLCTHPPATVITTAPTNDQVEKQLWKEIHTAYNLSKQLLGGKLTATQLDMNPNLKWFAYGFSTRPDTITEQATRFQGYHNDNVMVVFDEAAGIDARIWEAAEHLLTAGFWRWVAAGNPTSATGSFAATIDDPSWHKVCISVTDTPNFQQGIEIIPGVSGRAYEEMIRNKYGVDSNAYAVRVQGRKPQLSEGTYLGRWIAKAEAEGRTINGLYDPVFPVYTFSDFGDMYTAIWFMQFIKGQTYLVDFYYDAEGKGLPFYAGMLKGKNYTYGDHFSLPDIFQDGSNKKSLHTGQYTVDVAKSLGLNFKKIELPGRDDCIRAGQDFLNIVRFVDNENVKEGIAGLKDWKKRKNEQLSTPEKPVYHSEALMTWGRHVGDAFCGAAVAYRYTSIGGEVIGRLSSPLPQNNNNTKPYDGNALTRGMRRAG